MSLVLLIIHSIVRGLILILAVVALVKFAIGWLRKDTFKDVDQKITSWFSRLMDIQAALGLILLLWNGLVDGAGFPRYRLEHMVVMIVAVGVSHMSARWKNAADTEKFRNTFLLILGVLVLVFIGISRLPNGLSR